MRDVNEVITAKEALTRVGLADLAEGLSEYSQNRLVDWTGYPKPFACGHTAVYGYGPAKIGLEPGHKGEHREYQDLHRVSQHYCSGAVLFNWSFVQKGYNDHYFHLNTGMAVSIVELPDRRLDAALRVVFPA